MPGITGLTVYVPFTVLIVVLGVHDGLDTPVFLVTAFVVAAIIHLLEVGHTVFKRW